MAERAATPSGDGPGEKTVLSTGPSAAAESQGLDEVAASRHTVHEGAQALAQLEALLPDPAERVKKGELAVAGLEEFYFAQVRSGISSRLLAGRPEADKGLIRDHENAFASANLLQALDALFDEERRTRNSEPGSLPDLLARYDRYKDLLESSEAALASATSALDEQRTAVLADAGTRLSQIAKDFGLSDPDNLVDALKGSLPPGYYRDFVRQANDGLRSLHLAIREQLLVGLGDGVYSDLGREITRYAEQVLVREVPLNEEEYAARGERTILPFAGEAQLVKQAVTADALKRDKDEFLNYRAKIAISVRLTEEIGRSLDSSTGSKLTDTISIKPAEVATVGRTPQATYVSEDPKVSRVHLSIARTGTGITLYDQSTNGTYLNGERIPVRIPYPAKAGDKVTVGDTTFTLAEA